MSHATRDGRWTRTDAELARCSILHMPPTPLLCGLLMEAERAGNKAKSR